MAEASPPPGLRILGVLGGVGSGKSCAASMLAEVLPGPGFPLDADAEVSRLLSDPEVAAEVARALGKGLRRPDGLLDRRAVAARVFSDSDARERLERILHPEVRCALLRRLRDLEEEGGPCWAVLDVPLLLERGLWRACDFLVFIQVPDDLRRDRAMQRHAWSAAEWAAREAAQAPLALKEERADAILDNSRDLAALRLQIGALRDRLLALPPRPLDSRWPHGNEESSP